MSATEILNWIEVATSVVASLPTPIQPEAGLALQLEKIAVAALQGHAQSQGLTVEQVIAKLHPIQPIP